MSSSKFIPNKHDSSSRPVINKQNEGSTTVAKVETSFYKGIIPSPEMMEHYSRIDPSLPSRILAMAENEGSDRRNLNKRLVNLSFSADIFGRVVALIAAFGVIWLSYAFLKENEAEYGRDIAVSIIVALVATFLGTKYRSNNKKTEEKSNKN